MGAGTALMKGQSLSDKKATNLLSHNSSLLPQRLGVHAPSVNPFSLGYPSLPIARPFAARNTFQPLNPEVSTKRFKGSQVSGPAI